MHRSSHCRPVSQVRDFETLPEGRHCRGAEETGLKAPDVSDEQRSGLTNAVLGWYPTWPTLA